MSNNNGGIEMRQLSTKEIVKLGKDLNKAKIRVLLDYKFSVWEISNVMGISEFTLRKIIKEIEEEDKTK